MIIEIRIEMDDIINTEKSLMEILKEKGFPIDSTFRFALKPKAGLEYYQFNDPKTGELVIRWEE